MIYKILSNLIRAGEYDEQDMSDKLDVFFFYDRISLEEYQELMDIINSNREENN